MNHSFTIRAHHVYRVLVCSPPLNANCVKIRLHLIFAKHLYDIRREGNSDVDPTEIKYENDPSETLFKIGRALNNW